MESLGSAIWIRLWACSVLGCKLYFLALVALRCICGIFGGFAPYHCLQLYYNVVSLMLLLLEIVLLGYNMYPRVRICGIAKSVQRYCMYFLWDQVDKMSWSHCKVRCFITQLQYSTCSFLSVWNMWVYSRNFSSGTFKNKNVSPYKVLSPLSATS